MSGSPTLRGQSKARRGEVPVERECGLDAAQPHEGKAHGIGKAEALPAILPEQRQGLRCERSIRMHELDATAREDTIEKLERGPDPDFPHQHGMSFTDHQIGRNESKRFAQEARVDVDRARVVLIARMRNRDPRTGIDEDFRPQSRFSSW